MKNRIYHRYIKIMIYIYILILLYQIILLLKLKPYQLYSNVKVPSNKNEWCVLGKGTIGSRIVEECSSINFLSHEDYKSCNKYNVIFLCYKVRNNRECIDFTKKVLDSLTSPKILINFASDSEIYGMNSEYKKDKIKIRIMLDNSTHTVFHVFTPYQKLDDVSKYVIHQMNYSYKYHYYSTLSKIARPIYIKALYIERIPINEFCRNYGIVLFKPFLFQTNTLKFKGKVSRGKKHNDLNRCIGTTFRFIKTLKNTCNDYRLVVFENGNTILLENISSKLIIINNHILHQPLDMTHGDRIIEHTDYISGLSFLLGDLIFMNVVILKNIFGNF